MVLAQKEGATPEAVHSLRKCAQAHQRAWEIELLDSSELRGRLRAGTHDGAAL